jgi:hypothetical protein
MSPSRPGPAVELGLVTDFDPDVGLGQVETSGGGTYRFHCTSISGGSRQIEVATRVAFVVEPRGPGHWEAVGVTPVA